MLKLNKQVEMEVVKHETCQQYVTRRLFEGWKLVKQEGFKVILQSPEGIIRPVDIRNDIETLRPSAPGDVTEIEAQEPETGEHWDKVNEAEADDDATYVYIGGAYNVGNDLYHIPDHSVGSGTINKITVYFRCRCDYGDSIAKAVIKSDTTTTYGADKWLSSGWETFSQEWAINPADSQVWEWSDIDSLQIGIYLETWEDEIAQCTQVYVEVDYTPVVVYTPRHSGTVGVLMI